MGLWSTSGLDPALPLRPPSKLDDIKPEQVLTAFESEMRGCELKCFLTFLRMDCSLELSEKQ